MNSPLATANIYKYHSGKTFITSRKVFLYGLYSEKSQIRHLKYGKGSDTDISVQEIRFGRSVIYEG